MVAAEVKQLANQTAHSTAEIAGHIGAIRAATGASVESMTRIERTISDISMLAELIAASVAEQGTATAIIARNVAKTAEAAGAMWNRIGEVSGEAKQTGRHAAEVLDHTVALRESVGSLRQAVNRVVRTATPDVDRRHAARFWIDRPCRLTVAGIGGCEAHVADLSDGGARLSDGPELPPNATGALDLDGVGFPLPFRVLASDQDWIHVAFLLDPDAAAAFRAVPARLGRLLAAGSANLLTAGASN